jgi:hypothetical protein
VVPAVQAPGGACNAERFVTRAYQDLAGRSVDPAGLQYWLASLKRGASRTQVALGIMRTPEYRSNHAQNLYRAHLGRPADGIALDALAAMLQQGMTTEQVESAILASPTYFSERGGGSNDGFLAALFQDVLGRPVDPGSRAQFAQQLASGASRSSVAEAVLKSPESGRRWINALYDQLLHHAPSGTIPVTGGKDPTTAGIIGSEEYCRRP